MTKNESPADRAIRVILAATLLIANLLLNLPTAATIITLIASAILLLTAAVGYCPLYSLLKINTCKNPQNTTE